MNRRAFLGGLSALPLAGLAGCAVERPMVLPEVGLAERVIRIPLSSGTAFLEIFTTAPEGELFSRNGLLVDYRTRVYLRGEFGEEATIDFTEAVA
ncbi:MAG: hypothetical protein AB7P02_05180 [Alphaproteobacteria bacterium]